MNFKPRDWIENIQGLTPTYDPMNRQDDKMFKNKTMPPLLVYSETCL